MCRAETGALERVTERQLAIECDAPIANVMLMPLSSCPDPPADAERRIAPARLARGIRAVTTGGVRSQGQPERR